MPFILIILYVFFAYIYIYIYIYIFIYMYVCIYNCITNHNWVSLTSVPTNCRFHFAHVVSCVKFQAWLGLEEHKRYVIIRTISNLLWFLCTWTVNMLNIHWPLHPSSCKKFKQLDQLKFVILIKLWQIATYNLLLVVHQ
jgi:hypothetical protein